MQKVGLRLKPANLLLLLIPPILGPVSVRREPLDAFLAFPQTAPMKKPKQHQLAELGDFWVRWSSSEMTPGR